MPLAQLDLYTFSVVGGGVSTTTHGSCPATTFALDGLLGRSRDVSVDGDDIMAWIPENLYPWTWDYPRMPLLEFTLS